MEKIYVGIGDTVEMTGAMFQIDRIYNADGLRFSAHMVDAPADWQGMPEIDAAVPSTWNIKQPPKDTAKKYAAEIRNGYAEIWNTSKMVDYCANKVAAVAALSDGRLLTVDKQGIKKDFCFDDSFDYDGAGRMADHARSSIEYLRRQNLEDYEKTIADLDANIADPLARFVLVLPEKSYTSAPDGCKITCEKWMRATEIIDAFGGSCYPAEVRGASIEHYGRRYTVPTLEDLKTIRAAYAEALERHSKKVDAYIKRFGTSKVHAWTYWGMA